MPWAASSEYLHEKFFVAVDCLTTGPADIRSRLWSANLSALSRIEPANDLETVPVPCREEFTDLYADLTAHAPNQFNTLDEDACRELAKKVLNIFLHLDRERIRDETIEDRTRQSTSNN
jgi:hypothetical protein